MMASTAPVMISSVMSLVTASSSVRTVSDWVSTKVASVIRRRASSISPRPIKMRPTRPAVVSWRATKSTTPVKMHSGESQDRSSENTTAIRLEPTSAPSMMTRAEVSEIIPCPTNGRNDQRRGRAGLHDGRHPHRPRARP